MAETKKKTTKKATKRSSGGNSDRAKLQAEKRKDAEERAEEAGVTPSADANDTSVGWDAQQGLLPRDEDAAEKDRHSPAALYADDPPTYTRDQLPDEEVLKEAGLKPVLPETLIVDGDADEDDEDDEDETAKDD